MNVLQKGWPLGAVIVCTICATEFEVEQGDQDLVELDRAAGKLTVQVTCPGCHTRYEAVADVDGASVPQWKIAADEHQFNLAHAGPAEAPEQTDETEPEAPTPANETPQAETSPAAGGQSQAETPDPNADPEVKTEEQKAN